MSYDATAVDDLNLARALLGDTSNDSAELLTDDHIGAVLTLYGYNAGVAFLADELAIRYAQQPDRVTFESGASFSWSARVGAWRSMASIMRGVAAETASTAFSVASPRADGYATAESTDELGRPARLWP
jgi:hypothetical protein